METSQETATETLDEEALLLFDPNSAFNVEVFDRIARETLDVSIRNEKREFNRRVLEMLCTGLDPAASSIRLCSVLDSESSRVSELGKAIAAQMLHGIVMRRYRSFGSEQQSTILNSAVHNIFSLSSKATTFRHEAASNFEHNYSADSLTFSTKLLVETFKRTITRETAFVDELLSLARRVDSSQQRKSIVTAILRAYKMLVEDLTSPNSITSFQREDLLKALRADQRRIVRLTLDALDGRLYGTFPTDTKALIDKDEELVVRSLELLAALVPHLDLDCIFAAQFIDKLLNFLATPRFKVEALRCLIEIISLDVNAIDQGEDAVNMCDFERNTVMAAATPSTESITGNTKVPCYASWLATVFKKTMSCVRQFVDEGVDIIWVIDTDADPQNEQLSRFLYTVAVFLTTFLTKYAHVVEHPRYAAHSQLALALQYLVRFTKSASHTEMFKLCFDFWCYLSSDLLAERDALHAMNTAPQSTLNVNEKVSSWFQRTSSTASGVFSNQDPRLASRHGCTSVQISTPGTSGQREASVATNRSNIYRSHLREVVSICFERMPNPSLYREVADEFGEKRLEVVTYGDEPAIHEPMRETLRALTLLDYKETKVRLGHHIERLRNDASVKQCRQTISDRQLVDQFRRICFAVGSLAGLLNEAAENKLVLNVTADLLAVLNLRIERGPPREPGAAMFIALVDFQMQFKRYFSDPSNSEGFEQICCKLLEIIHCKWEERYVATEMFRRMAHDFGHCFVRGYFTDAESSRVAMLLGSIDREIMECADDSWPSNIITFHMAIAEMIAALGTGHDAQLQSRASSTQRTQIDWLDALMAPTNRDFKMRIDSLSAGRVSDLNSLRQISIILKTNLRVLDIVRKPFLKQLDRIIADCVPLFRMLSTAINNQLGACDGNLDAEQRTMQSELVLAMRAVRCDILKLLQCRMARFSEVAVLKDTMEKLQDIADNYVNSHPLAREPCVLRTVKAIANTSCLAQSAEIQEEYLTIVLNKLYTPTLEMLNEAEEGAYPEHEAALYGLLGSVILNAILPLSRLFGQARFEDVVETLLRGFRSLSAEIVDLALIDVHDLLERFGLRSSNSQRFFVSHFALFLNYSLRLLLQNLQPTLVVAQTELLRRIVRCVTDNVIMFPLKLCFEFSFEQLQSAEFRIERSQCQMPPRGLFRNDNMRELKQQISKIVRSVTQADEEPSYLLDEQIELFIDGMFALDDISQLRDHISEFFIEAREVPSRNRLELHLDDRRRRLAEILYRRSRDLCGSQAPEAAQIGVDVLAGLKDDLPPPPSEATATISSLKVDTPRLTSESPGSFSSIQRNAPPTCANAQIAKFAHNPRAYTGECVPSAGFRRSPQKRPSTAYNSYPSSSRVPNLNDPRNRSSSHSANSSLPNPYRSPMPSRQYNTTPRDTGAQDWPSQPKRANFGWNNSQYGGYKK